MSKYIRALAAPIGIAAGLGIYKLAFVVGVPANGAAFLGIAAGFISTITLFFIDDRIL